MKGDEWMDLQTINCPWVPILEWNWGHQNFLDAEMPTSYGTSRKDGRFLPAKIKPPCPGESINRGGGKTLLRPLLRHLLSASAPRNPLRDLLCVPSVHCILAAIWNEKYISSSWPDHSSHANCWSQKTAVLSLFLWHNKSEAFSDRRGCRRIKVLLFSPPAFIFSLRIGGLSLFCQGLFARSID